MDHVKEDGSVLRDDLFRELLMRNGLPGGAFVVVIFVSVVHPALLIGSFVDLV